MFTKRFVRWDISFLSWVRLYTTDGNSNASQVPGIQVYYPPSSPPTISPSSLYPTVSPTNSQCDETFRTNDSYAVCQILVSLSTMPDIFYNKFYLRDTNYCQINQFFKCNENNKITHIFLNNSNIATASQNIDLNDIVFSYLPSEVKYVDLSNNPNFFGYISDWSAVQRLETVIFSNCSLTGSVDFEQLSRANSSATATKLVTLILDNNDWESQTLGWEYLATVMSLEILDLSHNQFAGIIELEYISNTLRYFNVGHNLFSSIENFEDSIKELTKLEEFYINNNLISQKFDISWLPQSLLMIDCSSNSLSGDIEMNYISKNTITFRCGDNDFGTLAWEYSSYATTYEEYQLENLCLTSTKLTGDFDMQVFDDDGEFSNLKTVILSNNNGLNVSIEFSYLQSTQITYLDIRNTSHHGSVDFQYLTNSIEILMDEDVRCVSRYCTYVYVVLKSIFFYCVRILFDRISL